MSERKSKMEEALWNLGRNAREAALRPPPPPPTPEELEAKAAWDAEYKGKRIDTLVIPNSERKSLIGWFQHFMELYPEEERVKFAAQCKTRRGHYVTEFAPLKFFGIGGRGGDGWRDKPDFDPSATLVTFDELEEMNGECSRDPQGRYWQTQEMFSDGDHKESTPSPVNTPPTGWRVSFYLGNPRPSINLKPTSSASSSSLPSPPLLSSSLPSPASHSPFPSPSLISSSPQ
jgi:hypothetical protein